MAPRARWRGPLAPDYDPAHAVGLILGAHTRFLERLQAEEPEDAKGVATLHAAGRAVLAHAEHVVKVAALVGGEDTAPDLAALLAAARAQFSNEEEGESDGDPADGAG